MLGCWEGQVVTTSSVVPKPLAKALLEAGAHAVVCREAVGAAADESHVDAVAFFTAFYHRLLSGRPAVQALAHAGAQLSYMVTSCNTREYFNQIEYESLYVQHFGIKLLGRPLDCAAS